MLPLPLTFNFRGHPPKSATALRGARSLGRMLGDLHPARTADGRIKSNTGGMDVALQEGPAGVRARGKEQCLFLWACLPFSQRVSPSQPANGFPCHGGHAEVCGVSVAPRGSRGRGCSWIRGRSARARGCPGGCAHGGRRSSPQLHPAWAVNIPARACLKAFVCA